MENFIKLTDGYKITHWPQYPKGTQKVYAYFESRGGQFKLITFFGLQAILKKYMLGQVVTKEHIDEAEDFSAKYFGNANYFNRSGWEYILTKHGGHLPVVIKAVPEGTVVPAHNALMTVENTDEKCYWLTNYIETLLVQAWYPCTVATQSWYMKQKILDYLKLTGDPSLIDFKLHDFGFRGVSSVETAGMGGMAHLVNFLGTDTIQGITYADKYYSAGVCGHSIPASEHSTITSWGRDKESQAYKNMLTQYPTGLVACVSDSFDVYNACENLWGGELRMKVLEREGTLVIRPDSGDPPKVINKILGILGEQFGASKNEKGFKVLNPKVRVIQGDGIDYEMIGTILKSMTEAGWSADNIAFGSGGGLLQKLNRDTCKFAFKCSSVTVEGKERDVYKEPITDPGKNSKSGRLSLIPVTIRGEVDDDQWTYKTVSQTTRDDDMLEVVYRDGKLTQDHRFNDIKQRVKTTGEAVKKFEGLN